MQYSLRLAVEPRVDTRRAPIARPEYVLDGPEADHCPIPLRGRHVFLSPHFDDAIGSCGGLMARLIAAGSEVLIINMFAGAPTFPLSPAAVELHSRWGDPADCLALRRREDRAAAAVLGCTVHCEEVPEALYRRDRRGSWLYPELPELFRPPDPEDRALLPRFLARLSEYVSDLCSVYAPLGIGNHVDHQFAAEMGQRLRQAGRRVLFYQDFPYLLDRRLYAGRLRLLARSRSCVVACTEDQLAAKTRAFGQYASQLSSLFPDGVNLERQMLASAQFAGTAGGQGERYWQLDAPFQRSWRPRTTFYRLRRQVGAVWRNVAPPW